MSEKTVVTPKTNNHVLRTRKKKFTRKAVLKMLAVMEASQNAGPSSSPSTSAATPDSTTHAQEFLSSGRTGRRNALPDILGQHAIVTSSDLPTRLQSLTTADKSSDLPHDQPSTSSGKS